MIRLLRKLTLIRALLLTVGLAFVIVALFANRIGLSHSETLSKGKVLLLLAGIILFLIGILTRTEDFQNIYTFGKRAGDLYKASAILLLNSIVLLLILEAGASLFFKTSSVKTEATSSPVLLHGAYYSTQAWAPDYWYEHSIVVDQLQSKKYHPYTIWRRAPYNGKTINISQDGIRSTPGSNCEAGSYKVFVFGSSTTWGFGSPDWGTIPAYLQAGLGAMINKPVCTINYGEIGYVSTQEIIELILQLQAGNIPDLAIFYDGYNDTETAYEIGQAGVHYNLDGVAAIFEGRDAKNQNPIVSWLQSSSSFTMFQNLISRITPNQKAIQPIDVNYTMKGIDPTKLSDAVVQKYLTNYEVVDSISHQYGFKYLFFWQPVSSIGNKVLTEDEKGFTSRPPARSNFYDLVYHKAESMIENHQNIYYLANIFDQQTGQIWIDVCHINPVGNQLVAQKMLEVIKPLLSSH